MEMERPGLVSAAGITYIVAGSLALVGAFFMILGAMFFGIMSGSASGAWPWGEWFAAFGAMLAMIMVITAIVVAGVGTFVLITGIHVLKGRSWARVGGIVAGALMCVVGLPLFGEPTSSLTALVFVGAGVLGIVALVQESAQQWFAAKSALEQGYGQAETA